MSLLACRHSADLTSISQLPLSTRQGSLLRQHGPARSAANHARGARRHAPSTCSAVPGSSMSHKSSSCTCQREDDEAAGEAPVPPTRDGLGLGARRASRRRPAPMVSRSARRPLGHAPSGRSAVPGSSMPAASSLQKSDGSTALGCEPEEEQAALWPNLAGQLPLQPGPRCACSALARTEHCARPRPGSP